MNLATRCVMYLCQGHHDSELDDKQVIDKLLSGAYRLHNYASTFWLPLVTSCLQSQNSKHLPEQLVYYLDKLYETRIADGYDLHASEAAKTAPVHLALKEESPHVHDLLQHAIQFQKQISKDIYSLDEGKNSIRL